MSVPFSSIPLQLKDTHPVSPLSLAPDQIIDIDDISDIEDSDSDDDSSPIFGAITTITIPNNAADAKNLMTQAKAKHKTAIHKCKLADANFREAVLKAKLFRFRAQHARHVLVATKDHVHNVNWTIQRSKFRDVWSKPSHEDTTAADGGQHRTKVNHFTNIPGSSMAISLD